MKHDRTDEYDGTGDEAYADDVGDRIGEHNAVEEVFLLPLLLLAEVGAVDTCRHGCVRGDEGECCTEGAFRNLKSEHTLRELTAVRSTDTDEGYVERDDHQQDAERDNLLDLRIHILREVHVHDDGDHDGRTDLPVETEDQVHAGACACDITHREEEAGQEDGDTDDTGRNWSIILPDRVDGRQTGDDREAVRDHHKGDAHEDDREEQPHKIVAVVRTDHGCRRDCTRADDDTGCDETRTDTLQQVLQRETFDVFTENL